MRLAACDIYYERNPVRAADYGKLGFRLGNLIKSYFLFLCAEDTDAKSAWRSIFEINAVQSMATLC